MPGRLLMYMLHRWGLLSAWFIVRQLLASITHHAGVVVLCRCALRCRTLCCRRCRCILPTWVWRIWCGMCWHTCPSHSGHRWAAGLQPHIAYTALESRLPKAISYDGDRVHLKSPTAVQVVGPTLSETSDEKQHSAESTHVVMMLGSSCHALG